MFSFYSRFPSRALPRWLAHGVLAAAVTTAPALWAQDVQVHVTSDAVVSEDHQAQQQMHEAHELMREAAARYTELSKEASESRAYAYKFLTEPRRAMIGVIINSQIVDGQNQGVVLSAVTPGGPAEKAGLRSGDVLVSVDGHSLDDPNDLDSPAILREVLSGLEESDEIEFSFLRDGGVDSVTVVAERRAPSTFAPVAPMVISHNSVMELQQDGLAPHVIELQEALRFVFHGHFWEQIELVPLTAQLGRYFGTDEGLLVVNTPEDFEFDIQGGDVIKAINGRAPRDSAHAFRILRSFEQGEVIALDMIRDHGEVVVEIEVPERKSMMGWSWVPEDNELGGVPLPMQDSFVNGVHFNFSDEGGERTVIEIKTAPTADDDQL